MNEQTIPTNQPIASTELNYHVLKCDTLKKLFWHALSSVATEKERTLAEMLQVRNFDTRQSETTVSVEIDFHKTMDCYSL